MAVAALGRAAGSLGIASSRSASAGTSRGCSDVFCPACAWLRPSSIPRHQGGTHPQATARTLDDTHVEGRQSALRSSRFFLGLGIGALGGQGRGCFGGKGAQRPIGIIAGGYPSKNARKAPPPPRPPAKGEDAHPRMSFYDKRDPDVKLLKYGPKGPVPFTRPLPAARAAKLQPPRRKPLPAEQATAQPAAAFSTLTSFYSAEEAGGDDAAAAAASKPAKLGGSWTRADAGAVRRAFNDAQHMAPQLDLVPAQKSREVANNVLLGRSMPELEDLAVDVGDQKYRGRQLHQYLYKNKGTDYMDLQLLPKEFREELKERGFVTGRAPVHHVAAAADGTAKVLLRLDDERLVEAVGIPVEEARGLERLTACISSQVGCPLRCSFCATGKGGFARNLRPHEIVGQVLAIEDLFQARVSNVVFMGMGEPLLNLPAVLAAHRCLNRDLSIGQRQMTISTVGVPNTIQRLAQAKLQSTLAVSLHAPNQRLREQLVPSAKAYPLEALLQDCRAYFRATGRRVSFEYTLLAAVNDQPEHARELGELLRRWDLGHHVNVIPYNPVQDSDYRRPSKAYVLAFAEELKKAKITVSIRQTRGMEANAACGQLRNDHQKVPLPPAAVLAAA